MLSREIINTADGSQSIFVPGLAEHYHSVHGALQESEHVFMKNGLDLHPRADVSVLEVGFGTGLNALLALSRSVARHLDIRYQTIELYPLDEQEYSSLTFAKHFFPDLQREFELMHRCQWGEEIRVADSFSIYKMQVDLLEWEPSTRFDIVFFDAFAPDKQPRLWTEDVFGKISRAMNPGGVLSTYCCKGVVKRALRASGFDVELLPGPPGKREITVARKSS